MQPNNKKISQTHAVHFHLTSHSADRFAWTPSDKSSPQIHWMPMKIGNALFGGSLNLVSCCPDSICELRSDQVFVNSIVEANRPISIIIDGRFTRLVAIFVLCEPDCLNILVRFLRKFLARGGAVNSAKPNGTPKDDLNPSVIFRV